MEDAHIIYTDRLKDDSIETIDCTLAPAFIDVDEDDLSFPAEVRITGQAYIANEHLILNLTIHTSITKRCTICNGAAHRDITVANLYHSEELKDIRNAVFDIRPAVRSGLLLEVPHFLECNDGHCPERRLCKEYCKPSEKTTTEAEVHYPFADL